MYIYIYIYIYMEGPAGRAGAVGDVGRAAHLQGGVDAGSVCYIILYYIVVYSSTL